MAKAASPVPNGYRTVTPHLMLDNTAQGIEWYKKAFGAEEVSRAPGPDGRLMHAEIRIGDSRIMLNDEVMGQRGPKSIGGSPVSLWVYVPDCDAAYDRAVSAGAKADYPVTDCFWGDRMGAFKDPFGYSWSVATRKEDLTPQEMKQRQDEFMKQSAGSATQA